MKKRRKLALRGRDSAAVLAALVHGDELGAELPSTSALRYMLEVNAAAEGLGQDVVIQTLPGAPPNAIGQAFLGPWNDFLNAAPNEDEEADQVPVGWRTWFRDHSSLGARILHTDAIRKRTGEYERRLIELWEAFEKAGGKPSSPKPAVGYDAPPPSDDSPEAWADRAFKLGSVIAVVWGVGYLWRSARGGGGAP